MNKSITLFDFFCPSLNNKGVCRIGDSVRYRGKLYRVNRVSNYDVGMSLSLVSLDGKCKMYGVDSRMVERVR